MLGPGSPVDWLLEEGKRKHSFPKSTADVMHAVPAEPLYSPQSPSSDEEAEDEEAVEVVQNQRSATATATKSQSPITNNSWCWS